MLSAITEQVSLLRICCLLQACRSRSTVCRESKQDSPWDRYAGPGGMGHVVIENGAAAAWAQDTGCAQPVQACNATSSLRCRAFCQSHALTCLQAAASACSAQQGTCLYRFRHQVISRPAPPAARARLRLQHQPQPRQDSALGAPTAQQLPRPTLSPHSLAMLGGSSSSLGPALSANTEDPQLRATLLLESLNLLGPSPGPQHPLQHPRVPPQAMLHSPPSEPSMQAVMAAQLSADVLGRAHMQVVQFLESLGVAPGPPPACQHAAAAYPRARQGLRLPSLQPLLGRPHTHRRAVRWVWPHRGI